MADDRMELANELHKVPVTLDKFTGTVVAFVPTSLLHRAIDVILSRPQEEGEAERVFPIQNAPDIPWRVIAPHYKQALLNHGQTIERLAERGGLSTCEAVAILTDRPWQEIADDDEAKTRLQNIVRDQIAAASPLPVVPEEVRKIAEDLLDRVSRATPGPWESNTPPIKGYCEIHGGIDGDANDDGTLRMISTHVCDVIDNEYEQGNLEWIEAANPYAVEKLLRFIVGLGKLPGEEQ